ncbi:MAG: SusD/RagB family nutrient-binding outer membrane lipoprotein [Rhodothermia bacterium]|nr:SusD/RagB family nutrient-binding outer membrane lipoprotein [Rhodothermia bacterium]
MKTYFKIKQVALMMFLAVALTSCDDGFVDINTNPNTANSIDPSFQFTYLQLLTAGDEYTHIRANMIYTETFIQRMAVLSFGAHGDKYTLNDDYSGSLYNRSYSELARNMTDLLNTTSQDASLSNFNNMMRIWRVFTYQRVTDTYGMIPYSEAGQGVLKGIYNPKYDSQQDIYNSMIADLGDAASKLDASKKTPGSADIVYNGDVAKWKKFAYSLMLRMGMRLTKVDAAKAEATVKAAIAGGVFTSNADMPFVLHTDGPSGINNNGVAHALDIYHGDARISKTFIDMMKSRNDPRMAIYFQNPDGSADVSKMTGITPGTDPGALPANWKDVYAMANAKLKVKSNKQPLMTAAEVNLLMAEAVQRGWASGSAADYYNAGVKASMQMWSMVNSGLGSVSDADVTTYLNQASVKYDAAKATELIATQQYIATYLNGYEGFANWRRTGVPALTANNAVGNLTGGTIPRRLMYPAGEAASNPEGYNAAVTAQGANEFKTRVWWDK